MRCGKKLPESIKVVVASFELEQPLRLRFQNEARYAPALLPHQHVREELREQSFYNKTFATLDALENPLPDALSAFEMRHGRIKSIAA